MTMRDDEEMFGEEPDMPDDFLFSESEAESGNNVVPLNFALTDMGNADRLVAKYRNAIRYCTPRKRWYTWNGKRWKLDEVERVVRMAKHTALGIKDEIRGNMDAEMQRAYFKWAQESQGASKLGNMLKLAQCEIPIALTPDALDANPNVFNCNNGTLDLSTGKLEPFDRNDLITKITPVDYDPTARSELWESWLEQATGGDKQLQAYMARAVGYALQGTISERAFFFVYGPPGTSKSTFIDVIAAMFGEYHVGTSEHTWLKQTQIGGNRPDLVRLLGARLATCSEFAAGSRFDASLIKNITGGDTLEACAKFESPIQFKPSCKVWFAANDAPTVSDADEGFMVRMRRIPFEATIPIERQDRTMKDRLRQPDVLRAVLAWAVRGLQFWQSAGLGSCDAVDRSTEQYRKDLDQLGDFLEDTYERDIDGFVYRADATKAYIEWAKANLVRYPMSARELAKRMRAAGFVEDKVMGGKRVWRGVRAST